MRKGRNFAFFKVYPCPELEKCEKKHIFNLKYYNQNLKTPYNISIIKAYFMYIIIY